MDSETPSIFEEIVLESSGVCNNCFSRTHFVDEDWYPGNLAESTKKTLKSKKYYADRTQTISVYGPFDDDPVKTEVGKRRGQRLTHPTTKNICRCGSIDSYTKRRPLSTQRAIQLTHNLVERLEEQNIEFDQDTLYDSVSDLKSDSKRQFEDDAIFEESIERAVVSTE